MEAGDGHARQHRERCAQPTAGRLAQVHRVAPQLVAVARGRRDAHVDEVVRRERGVDGDAHQAALTGEHGVGDVPYELGRTAGRRVERRDAAHVVAQAAFGEQRGVGIDEGEIPRVIDRDVARPVVRGGHEGLMRAVEVRRVRRRRDVSGERSRRRWRTKGDARGTEQRERHHETGPTKQALTSAGRAHQVS